MINEALLKSDEKAILSLRALYRSYGYLPFKMSKFEEYDFYMKNKEFLISDSVITFNDTDGTLLALKPDVTLSIVRSGKDIPGEKQKVCYDESVYRISGSTHQYREILQTGLECIGDLCEYDIFEAVQLAARSLSLISEEYVLSVSHLGLLTALLQRATPNGLLQKEIARTISEKNPHGIEALCRENGIAPEAEATLRAFAELYGTLDEADEALPRIFRFAEAEAAIEDWNRLSRLLKTIPEAAKIRFDGAIVSDTEYYNGVVFQGYLSGICEQVLAGGQYNKLLRKMGRTSDAIGFALYLDKLEQNEKQKKDFDIDTVLLCDNTVPAEEAAAAAEEIRSQGKSVSVLRQIPRTLCFRTIRDLRKEQEK